MGLAKTTVKDSSTNGKKWSRLQFFGSKLAGSSFCCQNAGYERIYCTSNVC